MRSTNNNLNIEIQNRHDVEKALGVANHEKTQLVEKLKAAESAQKSTKARLKNAEAQAEDQRKELYTTQLNLATEQAAILDLKAKLQKAKEELKVAQEAAVAAENSAYERGMLETEARLTAEVTVVCREYCVETYNQALDRAGISADSDLRRVDQVYYPDDLRENTTAPPYPAALPPLLLNNLLSSQNFLRVPKHQQGPKKRRMGQWWLLRQRRKRRRRKRERKRQRIKLMPTPPRTPLPLEIWFPRLKLLSPSPRLTPRKIFIIHRLRHRVLAFSFVIFVMALRF